MHAQLVPLDGGKPLTLKRDITVVGRKPGVCDLVLDRSSVSKLHCIIVKTDGLLFIRDLGSTNGTKVNGQRVTRGALLPNDELAFASIRFRIHLGPSRPEDENGEESTEMITPRPEAAASGEFIELEDAAEAQAAAPQPAGAQSESDVRWVE